jgi:hypothetical protein
VLGDELAQRADVDAVALLHEEPGGGDDLRRKIAARCDGDVVVAVRDGRELAPVCRGATSAPHPVTDRVDARPT